MNRATVCKLEKLPTPTQGGDTYTVQANLLPLEKLGQDTAQSQQVSEVMKAWLGIKQEA
jgi:hypothetical protein